MHFQGPAVDDDDSFEKMSRDYGTSHELARKYNGGGQAEKDRIKQGVNTALAWEAKATNRQRAAQRQAAEKIGDYKTASNGPRFGGGYDDMGNLTATEVESFFRGTPEGRKAIAAPLNAALQPWAGTYDPATPAPRVTAIDRWDLTEEERNNRLELAGALTLASNPSYQNQSFGTAEPKQYAANTFATTMSDAQETAAPSAPSTSDPRADDTYEPKKPSRPAESRKGADNEVAEAFRDKPFWRGMKQFFRDIVFKERYGNFCGPNWTNGLYKSGQKPPLTEEIDPSGINPNVPIDRFDAACMYHDDGYWNADQSEKEGKPAKAREQRREADVKLLKEIVKIRQDLKKDPTQGLGIRGEGYDDRTKLLNIIDPVEARGFMAKAEAFFSIGLDDEEGKARHTD